MTKKRLLSVLVVLCMTSMYSMAETDTIKVSTARALHDALAGNPTATIHITQDIDLSNFDWEPIETFSGKLDAEALTGEQDIYARDADGNIVKDKDSTYMTLGKHCIKGLKTNMFRKLENAALSHIFFDTIDYKASGGSGSYNGVIALEATGTSFMYLSFDKCNIQNGNIAPDLTNYPNYVGLVAGLATNCTFSLLSVSRSTIFPRGCEVGSMVGKAEGCDFAFCYTDMLTTVYGESGGDCKVGGICGWAVKNGSSACTFTQCVNMATVAEGYKGDQLGGIVGCSEGAVFQRCQNYGMVSHVTDVTVCEEWSKKLLASPHINMSLVLYDTHLDMLEQVEWIGYGYSESVQDLATATEQFSLYAAAWLYVSAIQVAWMVYQAQDPDEVGGICGYADGGTITQCMNCGYIHTHDAYGGGIVGYATGGIEIIDCLNRANVLGDEQVGGIVGTLDGSGSIVTSCINTGAYYAEEDTKGPIYGQLSNGATSGGNHYTIGYVNSPTGVDICTATRQQFASGRVAQAINTAAGGTDLVWRQTVGSMIYPEPGKIGTKAPGTDGNAIDDNANCWVTVSNIDELIAALRDNYAWIKFDSAITLCEEEEEEEEEYNANKGIFEGFFDDFYDAFFGSQVIKGTDGTYGLSTQQFPFRGKIKGTTFYGLKHYQTVRTADEDYTTANIALFNYAENAVFENITFNDIFFVGSYNTAALVANSKNCTYKDVAVGTWGTLDTPFIGCSGHNVGTLVGISENDKFVGCSAQTSLELPAFKTGGKGNIFADGFSTSTEANIGGLVGNAKGSTFTDCWNTWWVVGNDDHVGGIVGKAENCTFELCRNEGKVSHDNEDGMDDELGGIVGYANSCTFNRCTNSGDCIGGDAYIGGIAGYADGNCTFTNCLNTGKVQGDEQTGGIVGYINDGTIRNCFVSGKVYIDNEVDVKHEVLGWDKLYGKQDGTTTCSNNYIEYYSYEAIDGKGALVTNEQTVSGQVTWWLNESDPDITIWRQCLYRWSDDTPVVDPTHSVITPNDFTNIRYISNEEELLKFSKDVLAGTGAATETVVLTADICLSAPKSGDTSNWVPIGTVRKTTDGGTTNYDFSHAFSGIFRGNGHTVSNVQVIDEHSYHGFFGAVTNGAVISDLIVEGTITGTNGVGGIIGAAEATSAGTVTILRCGNRATVTASDVNAGGIIGAVYNSDDIELVVENCWNTGTVTGKQSGSLCGNFKKKATFTNCWNSGAFNAGAGETNDYPYVRYTDISKQTLDLVNCYQMEGLPHGSYSVLTLPTFTEADMKNGNLCHAMNQFGTTNQELVWQQNVGTDTQPLFGSKGLYHTRTMTNEYGTVCLPYALRSNDDVAFYTLTSAENGTLVFTYASGVEAGTPCLAVRLSTLADVQLECMGNNFATSPLTISAVDGYTPVGTYSTVTDKTGCYYVAQDKLWYATKAITIPAYRAWFETTVPGASLCAIAIRIDGTTAIIPLEEDGSTAPAPANAFIYDLSGRRYEPGTPLAPGIYIVGGKKVMVSNK